MRELPLYLSVNFFDPSTLRADRAFAEASRETVPGEQKMLKGHLSRVIYQVYWDTKKITLMHTWAWSLA